jgi:DNA-binding response OmpR family regulator
MMTMNDRHSNADHSSRNENSNRRSAPKGSVMRTARKKILIADCHEEVLIVLERVLEDAGFDTTTVWTAREALKLMETQAFDLVLVNEYLPDSECEELLRALQNKGTQLPCIVMQPSAPEITDTRSLRKLGAREIVCKWAHQQVLDAIGRCLASRQPKLVA